MDQHEAAGQSFLVPSSQEEHTDTGSTEDTTGNGFERETHRYQLSVHARPGTLLGMYVVNMLLTLLTAGIYSFWGRARVRRYLYNQVELLGQRFMYHGTGLELFLGTLKLLALLVPFGALIYYKPPIGIAALYLGAFFFMPLAVYGSRRYLMSRMSWQGIRFSFRGSLLECYLNYLVGGLLMMVTLGLYFPYFRVRMRKYWMGNTWFGTLPFRYRGEGGGLARTYYRYVWKSIVVAAAMIGLGMFLGPKLVTNQTALMIVIPLAQLLFYGAIAAVWCFWDAAEQEFHWQHTTVDQVRFYSTMTGAELIKLRLKHLLILVFTLGFGFAWVQIDKIRFLFEHLDLMECPELAGVVQAEEGLQANATGEAAADILEVDTGLELGI